MGRRKDAIVLTALAPFIPTLDVAIAGGIGIAFAGVVALYGRRHAQWSRDRNTPR